MNQTIKACSFIVITALYPANNLFAAGACSADTTIFFGNGVTVERKGARESMKKLSAELQKTLPPEEFDKLSFDVAYNPNGGVLLDLFESLEQKLGSDTSLFVRFLGNTLNSLDKLVFDVIPDFFSDALIAVSSGITNLVARDEDVRIHVGLYKAQFLEGKKVIVVAHSQGNFFANLAYSKMTAEELQSFGIVSVGNPDHKVGVIGSGLPYTTADQDIVIRSIIGSLSSNVDNGFSSENKTGHSWIPSYMRLSNTGNARRKILRDIVNVRDDLIAPESQVFNGVITTTLTWGNQPDVDLHVFEPNGEHVYWRNQQGISGAIDLDDVDGYGPEHYFVDCNTLEEGTYSVAVNYYFGTAPETATILIQAGDAIVRSFDTFLPFSNGSSGDNNPIPVADIVVFKNEDGSFDFSIQQ